MAEVREAVSELLEIDCAVAGEARTNAASARIAGEKLFRIVLRTRMHSEMFLNLTSLRIK